MNIFGAIIAGLVGTAVMTAIMYMAPYMGFPKMDMIGMLGTMFTEPGTGAIVLGAVVHFMMGAIFAVVYVFLWTNVVGDPTWLWGLIFGILHGIIAIVVMPMMKGIHPRPEHADIKLSAMTVIGMLMGHAIFGLVTALVYNALV